MKQKVLALLMALLVCVTGFCYGGTETRAADEVGEDVDLSYLMTDTALIGYMNTQTRGRYLLNGYSFINEISSSKIGVGGCTNANVECEVSVTCIVERKVSGNWVRVTSWAVTREKDMIAIVSKSLSVGSGYYYRVRSLHSAASESGSSYTDALLM